MAMKSRNPFLVPFVVVAVISVAILFFVFDLRYMWYLSANDANFLRAGFGTCLLVITALWVVYPSRILVAGIGLVCFAFPPILRPKVFVGLDVKFSAFVFLSLLMLAIATELRQRMKRRTSETRVVD
jgi:hypothetical protein